MLRHPIDQVALSLNCGWFQVFEKLEQLILSINELKQEITSLKQQLRKNADA